MTRLIGNSQPVYGNDVVSRGREPVNIAQPMLEEFVNCDSLVALNVSSPAATTAAAAATVSDAAMQPTGGGTGITDLSPGRSYRC